MYMYGSRNLLRIGKSSVQFKCKQRPPDATDWSHRVLPAHKTSHYQLTVLIFILILTIIIGIYKTWYAALTAVHSCRHFSAWPVNSSYCNPSSFVKINTVDSTVIIIYVKFQLAVMVNLLHGRVLTAEPLHLLTASSRPGLQRVQRRSNLFRLFLKIYLSYF